MWRILVKMVKLKFNGKSETFFHFDGKKYKTEKFVVDNVPDEAADYILSNPRWSKISYAKKKKTKED
jgi:hypothetical protein|tara:strand:+ start:324 stop:524 length:201 start_codon:yes stop_codon:yes gene_type:complete